MNRTGLAPVFFARRPRHENRNPTVFSAENSSFEQGLFGSTLGKLVWRAVRLRSIANVGIDPWLRVCLGGFNPSTPPKSMTNDIAAYLQPEQLYCLPASTV